LKVQKSIYIKPLLKVSQNVTILGATYLKSHGKLPKVAQLAKITQSGHPERERGENVDVVTRHLWLILLIKRKLFKMKLNTH
jgi:hypothetical protein